MYAKTNYSTDSKTCESLRVLGEYRFQIAEEVAADHALRVIRFFHLVARAENPHAYLHTMICNLIRTTISKLNHCKERSNKLEQGDEEKQNQMIEHADHRECEPDRNAEMNEEITRLEWALGQLPPLERLALRLFYKEKHRYKVIAKTMGITTNAVGILLLKAKRHLQKLLKVSNSGECKTNRRKESYHV